MRLNQLDSVIIQRAAIRQKAAQDALAATRTDPNPSTVPNNYIISPQVPFFKGTPMEVGRRIKAAKNQTYFNYTR